MEKKQINVYVMIGLPGAGKDTWIKNNLSSDVKVVCRDDIRAELGYCNPGEKIIGTNEQEFMVSSIFNTKLKMFAREGYDIAINNINIRRQYRNDYKKILSPYDVKWIYVVVEAPSVEVNKQRRNGQIPDDAWDRLVQRFQAPTPDEYDEIIYDKQ